MEFENIILEKKERVAKITINRPEARNALDMKTREELLVALDDVEKDDKVRVVVFTGAGDKAFVSGADIRIFEDKGPVEMLDFSYSPLAGSMIENRLQEMGKPVIAAINGFALGGGCEFAMGCDIRIAAENARFGQPEINIGIMPGAGGTQRLPRLVGVGKAKELCFTGDIIDAQEALRLGLVNKVVPLDKLEETTMELARKIANKSPLMLQYIKRSINMSQEAGLSSGLAFEIQSLSTCFGTKDKEEGVAAFLEKRKPKFKGK